MLRGNEEQVVSQKLRRGLDNLHAVSQVTLGLASWTGIGLQGLFQLTIGSRLAFVRNKNSPKPHKTCWCESNIHLQFQCMSCGVSVRTGVFDTLRPGAHPGGTTSFNARFIYVSRIPGFQPGGTGSSPVWSTICFIGPRGGRRHGAGDVGSSPAWDNLDEDKAPLV